MSAISTPFAFELPPELDVHEPPEARGLNRDQVRVMVAYRHDGRLIHTEFRRLAHFLSPGDPRHDRAQAAAPRARLRSGAAEQALHAQHVVTRGVGRKPSWQQRNLT